LGILPSETNPLQKLGGGVISGEEPPAFETQYSTSGKKQGHSASGETKAASN